MVKLLIILGANGFLGTHLIKHLSSSPSCFFDKIIAIDSIPPRDISSFQPEFCQIEFIEADVTNDDYLLSLNNSSDNSFTILNLVAQDYPVTSNGIGQSFDSPFCLPPEQYSASLVTTSTSSYNIFFLLEKYGLLNSYVLLVGSIYSHILPNPSLYSKDLSLWKPIAYSAGKYSQIPLYKQAAVYMAKYGGRCNCISFGGIESDQSQEFKQSYSEIAPQSCMVPIDDVIATILWMLNSPPNSINGAELMVDGAFSVN